MNHHSRLIDQFLKLTLNFHCYKFLGIAFDDDFSLCAYFINITNHPHFLPATGPLAIKIALYEYKQHHIKTHSHFTIFFYYVGTNVLARTMLGM